MNDADLPKANIDRKLKAFFFWNGEPPVPQITHWTAEGTVTIRGKTPQIATEVVWRGRDNPEARVLGGDGDNPYWPARNLRAGNYDRDAGFLISALVPEHLHDWNDLGG